MWVGGRAHSVNSDGDTAVGTVFEANGEGTAAGELAVELGFGGARTDRSPRDEVLMVDICVVRR